MHPLRMSKLLYQGGFGFWMLYLMLGTQGLYPYKHYKPEVAVLCGLCMVLALGLKLHYEREHHPDYYLRIRNALFVLYVLLGLILFYALGSQNSLSWIGVLF